MQPLNASPMKPSLGLPIPASPADSGFLPRREFLPSSSRRPLSTFALLAFSNTSSIRLSAFPPPIIHLLNKFFEDRKLLKTFRENKSPLRDKEQIDRDTGASTNEKRSGPAGVGNGRTPGEEEDLAEFTLTAKFWANPKSLETEKMLVQILVLLNSQGYSLLTSIDFGREPGDKLTLVFERPAQYLSPTQYTNPAATNGSTSHIPMHHHQNSTGSASAQASGSGSTGPIKQLLFGLSFTSQTSFRCINPPLESTPGILQALRGAWPRGIESENKVSEGCYEFKLKGYSFFAEDTFQTDSLELTLSLLKSMQRLQFSLIASLTLTSSHAKTKDLWIFSTTETDSLSPSQLLTSISASPVSYAGGVPLGLGGGSVKYNEKEGSHLRSASADVFQQQPQGFSTPGHQRNATTPVFGSSATLGGGSLGKSAGPPTPRAQGSVLVKKSPSAKASPKPNNANVPLVAAVSEAGSTPPGTGNKSTTPPKASTPPTGKAVGMMSPGGPKAMGSKYPYQQGGPQGQGQGQNQAVLYSTPTSGNVLYSTPPSSPPAGSYTGFPSSPSGGFMPPPVAPHHPNDGHWSSNQSVTSGSTMQPSSPHKHLLPASGPEDDGPTPPLLSSAAFRDTISDQDTIRDGRESTFSGGTNSKAGGSAASVMSGRSGESVDVPVMWTGSGGLANVGMAAGAVGVLGTTLEEDEREVSPTTPGVPGGWVEDPMAGTAKGAAGRNSREATRSSKEKERAFEAKVDGAQLVTVPSPSAAQEAAYANAGGILPGAEQDHHLGRRKSQEAVVHNVPGASDSKDTSKSNGWVMVNVSGTSGGGESRPEHKKTFSSTTARPPPGPLRAVNASPHSSSSTEAPTPVAAGRTTSASNVPPTSYNVGDLASGSGGESTSSVDKSVAPSSIGHGNAVAGGTETTRGKPRGFRRLFSRDKGEKKSDERMRLGGLDESTGTSPKKGKRGGEEETPSRASRKMTID